MRQILSICLPFWFAAVTADPIYRHSLRHLPEKLRQERIQQTTHATFLEVKQQIFMDASQNRNETSFTLFCLEPNQEQDRMEQEGFCLFQKENQKYRLSLPEEMHLRTQYIQPKPECNPKDGYELYNRYRTKLEDDPLVYIQHFFILLNYQFPDVTLTLSHERKGTGLFESECCPIYTVSW